MKYWEIIANNLSKAGWSLGWILAVDIAGRTIWVVDAHRGAGKRFVVRADEKRRRFGNLNLLFVLAASFIKEIVDRLTSISALGFEKVRNKHKSSFQEVDPNNPEKGQFSRGLKGCERALCGKRG